MSDNRVAVLLEDIQGKLTSLADSVSVLAQDMHEVKETIAPIPEMTDDIKAIKAVLAGQSRHQRDLESRMTHLETMPKRA